MVNSISVLGCTGSIGRQTLAVARHTGIHVAEDPHFDVVALHGFDRLVQILVQQAHNGFDFLFRPLPVFRREGIDGQVIDAEVPTVRGDFPEVLRTDRMAGRTGQTAFFRPAPVPVQNNRNMAGDNIFPRRFVLCGCPHQISVSSFSFFSVILSISLI